MGAKDRFPLPVSSRRHCFARRLRVVVGTSSILEVRLMIARAHAQAQVATIAAALVAVASLAPVIGFLTSIAGILICLMSAMIMLVRISPRRYYCSIRGWPHSSSWWNPRCSSFLDPVHLRRCKVGLSRRSGLHFEYRLKVKPQATNRVLQTLAQRVRKIEMIGKPTRLFNSTLRGLQQLRARLTGN